MADLFWIETPPPGRLAVLPRPEGGDLLEDEVLALRRQGVDVLVSLLEQDEAAGQDLEHEGGVCEAAGMEFLSRPIPDHQVPGSPESVAKFVGGLVRRFRSGKKIAIHCMGGIGRSPTIAAAVMVELGLPVDQILERLSKARGFPVPETAGQMKWVLEYALRRPRC